MLNGTQLGEQIVLKNNDMFTISDRSFKFCTIGGSSNTQKVRRRNARSAQPARPAPAAGLLFFLPPGREEWLLMFNLLLPVRLPALRWQKGAERQKEARDAPVAAAEGGGQQ